MKVKPKFGIDNILFGMKRADIIGFCGNPDREFKDEDKNIIFLYNDRKLRLTFYEDEGFRLGYIITSLTSAEILGEKIIGKMVADVKSLLKDKGLKNWTEEAFDISTNHFNEENWIILEEEFGEVVKIEIGAMIVNDEFEWKFN